MWSKFWEKRYIKAHMDILSFWNLKERPFEDLRNPRFYFESEDHREALERLLFLCQNKNMNMGMLTGEIGCGKTMTRTVLETRLEQNQFAVAILPNSNFNFNDLLYDILAQVRFQHVDFSSGAGGGLALRLDKYSLMQRFKAMLEIVHKQERRHLVVIFDEAQQMESPVLEEIKNLTNLNSPNENYITIILVGQPELREKITTFKQIDQRISLRFHLNALDFNNTGRYLRHRLQVAGSAQPNIFTQKAISPLFAFTRGIPREINRVANLAMEMAAALGSREIMEDTICSIIKDLDEHRGCADEADPAGLGQAN